MSKKLAWMLVALWLIAGCGGGGESGGEPSEPPGQASPPAPQSGIGPAGGTVTGPGGAKVIVPPNALSQQTDIAVTQSSAGAPPLPAGVTPVGEMFAFTPHGTTFASPVTVTVPFEPAQVPAGATLTLLKTNATQTGWEEVAGATVEGSSMSGSVSAFSWILVSRLPPPPPPVENTQEPQRFHGFSGFNIDGAPVHISGNLDPFGQKIGDPHPPGELLVTERFGSTFPADGDPFADGEVFSSPDGTTYWVQAESPTGDLLAQDPDRTFLGSRSALLMGQSYRKNSANATMELVITQANLRVIDFNGSGPQLAGCPWSGAAENTLEDCYDKLSAELSMVVLVSEGGERDRAELTVTGRDVYESVAGTANLDKSGTSHHFTIWGNPVRGIARYKSLWTEDHFTTQSSGEETEVRLRETLRVPIDLSNVPECLTPLTPEECPEFTVETMVFATAHNRRAGESYAMARLRDPLNIDGVTVITTGLTPTNRPLLDDIEEIPLIELPSECTAGDDPGAGRLEFDAASYRVMEFGTLRPHVFVVRRGGSRGEVTATVTAIDGTAVAGTHYSAVTQTVIFGDGDTLPRAIRLPTIDNAENDGNVALQLVLNAEPGCATLGDPSTADVVIIDDEAVAPPAGPSGALDDTFGTGGKVNTAPFGGEQSAMALQADGKIVMAGGTFTGFVIARFNPDGSLDSTFGDNGQVTTAIDGIAPRARAVAIQSDGKIVVAGETQLGGNNSVALARYNPDGSIDSSFGTAGKVVGTVVGRAYAVAVQEAATEGERKIVVAGDAPVDGDANDFGDVLVARFNADGSLDASFGDDGVSVGDVTGSTDLARNLVLLPDGDIVVAGDPFGTNASDGTAVVRLNANGTLDGDFGTGGIVRINERVGRGLARQVDGKLLLVGASSVIATSQFATMRLNADGSIDTSFGTNGLVTTSVSGSTSGVGDVAQAVTVRPDGHIYVAGVSGSLNQNFGLVRYTSNGTLDDTFATGGIVTIDFNGLADGAENIALLGDGRILLGGFATPVASDGFGLARLHP